MRISEIKKILGSGKAAQYVSFLWEIYEYRVDLSAFHKEQATADDVFRVVADTYVCFLETTPKNTPGKEEIQRLSRELYGYKNAWAKGTKWEELINQHRDEQKQKVADRKASFEKLQPLYERLGLTRIQKSDILSLISKEPELSMKVAESVNSIETLEQLYDVCEACLVPKVNTDQFKYRPYLIMGKISRLAYGKPSYWTEKNNISNDELVERLHIKRKAKEEAE